MGRTARRAVVEGESVDLAECLLYLEPVKRGWAAWCLRPDKPFPVRVRSLYWWEAVDSALGQQGGCEFVPHPIPCTTCWEQVTSIGLSEPGSAVIDWYCIDCEPERPRPFKRRW